MVREVISRWIELISLVFLTGNPCASRPAHKADGEDIIWANGL